MSLCCAPVGDLPNQTLIHALGLQVLPFKLKHEEKLTVCQSASPSIIRDTGALSCLKINIVQLANTQKQLQPPRHTAFPSVASLLKGHECDAPLSPALKEGKMKCKETGGSSVPIFFVCAVNAGSS